MCIFKFYDDIALDKHLPVLVDIEYSGDCERGIYVVNLGCQYSSQILVNTFLQYQGKGWDC